MTKRFFVMVFQAITIAIVSIVLFEISLHVLSMFVGKESRHDHIKKGADFTVVTVGDSNTWGLFVEKNEAWPSVLQKKFDEVNMSVNVVNLAYPGTNSTQINKNLKSILEATDPDYILFMAGVNDGWTQLYFDEDVSVSVVDWLKEHSRSYKAFLLIYKGHIKNSVLTIGEGNRLIKERHDLSDDKLREKIVELVNENQKKDEKFIVVNGELIHVGEIIPTDKNKADETMEKISKKYETTVHYSVGEIVKKIRGTKTKLILVTYPAYSGGYISYSRYNELMREAAKQYNLLLIENELPRFMPCEEDLTCHGYLLPDEHPSPLGHQFIAGHAFESLSVLLAGDQLKKTE